jgi:2-C-methyl-D-erythritol 4-phosphate cytidylyltransferase/2-C-methyl-D-erythritol 2,4-cyclodiphosphate synthase
MDKIVALITASGRGTRFSLGGEGIPKQYMPLAGVPLLRHTILAFLNHPKIDDVICTIHPDDVKLYEEATIGLDLLNPVFGGQTRQSSVRNGLEGLKDCAPQKVLIHDGARPFTTKRVINGILEKLETHPAVIPAIAIEDTIKKYSNGKIEWTLERENLWRAQTPQGFIYEDILTSHKNLKHMNFTDDAALDEYCGIPVAIVPGSQNNFKITTEEDYERAKRIIALRIDNVKEEVRSGIGYDVHAFRDKKEGEDGLISIAGHPVKFDKKIEAHSDGDAALHAVIDALLGAAGQGDIGEHFSNSDPKWEDCDSKEMLRITNHLLRKKGAKILNIDLTVICESPKISKHKKDMEKAIATTLNISQDRVNVKATTTEKLGFLGRKEGIAAHAICSLSISTLIND